MSQTTPTVAKVLTAGNNASGKQIVNVGAVGVGTTTVSPSAAFQVNGTTKGVLIPRMTTTEMELISSPATGLLVFNTTVGSFYYYSGATWVAVVGSSDLSSYVPYSGADSTVNLNGQPLINVNSIAVGTSTLTTGVSSEFRNTGTIGNNVISTSVYSLPKTTFATGYSTLRGFASAPTTGSGTYTLAVSTGFTALDVVKSGSSAVNENIGFLTGSLSAGEYNRGFYGDVPVGDNNTNLYMSSKANNYLGGPLQIGTGTITPNPSAALEMGDTTKGLLAPRLTTTQMNAVSSPAEGLLIYNTTAGSFYYYDAGWNALGGSFLTVRDTAVDFPEIPAGDSGFQSISVPGAVLGDAVFVGPDPTSGATDIIFTCSVSSADTVSLKATNPTAAPINLAPGTFTVSILR